MGEDALDGLLSEMLASPERPVDTVFVARVDKAVAEAKRHRRLVRSLRSQLITEALALLAIGGGVAVLTQAPQINALVVGAPWLFWPALLMLFLMWLFISSRSRILA